MKKILFLFSFLYSSILCIGQGVFPPTTWLRAASAILGVASWPDVSGNGLDAVPSSGTMPTAFSRMNFNRCFEVGGTETFTLSLGINDSQQSDVILVYETYDTVNENALWQVQLDTAKRIGQTTQRILNDNGQIAYDTANRLRPVINYLAQSWRTPEVCAPTLTLCAADSLTFSGRIAEALYFDRRIGDTAVIQWISYLAIKYGITLSQTDYLDSHRNVIWDYTNYPGYSTSIAGVGRDDSLGLYQKQSYFADGRMIFGVNHLTPTNEDNPSIVHDGDFILIGMDSVGLDCPTEIYTQSGEAYEVIGCSMAQVTGDACSYSTFILLDTTVETVHAPSLLIDRSGTGGFPSGEMDQILSAGTDSTGHYIYRDVHWDTDQSGRDFFCFAITMPDTVGTPRALTVNDTQSGGTGQTSTGQSTYASQQQALKSAQLRDEKSTAPQYRLLPNPNHGNFTVEVAYPEIQDVTVTVYDSDGRLLITMEGKGQCAYSFENTMPTVGHYLIDITSPSEHKTLKMVVN